MVWGQLIIVLSFIRRSLSCSSGTLSGRLCGFRPAVFVELFVIVCHCFWTYIFCVLVLLIMSSALVLVERPIEERIAAANELKDQGNALLALNKYAASAEKYSAAIELHPTAIFYSNRAQAMIKTESYGLAISDANEALKYVNVFAMVSVLLFN